MKKNSYKYSDITKNLIIIDYFSGKTFKEVAKKYHIGATTVGRILNRNSLFARSISDAKKIYFPKDDFFDNLDTFEKAYIFGLLLSDGCNVTNINTIKISLQEGDKDILEKLGKILFNGNVNLNFHNRKHLGWKNQYSLSIRSKKISKRLLDLGMFPDKTHTLDFPESIYNDELLAGLILGFFDGDGWMYVNKKYNSGEFAIVSTFNFVSKLKDKLKERLNINSFLYKKKIGFVYSLKITKSKDIHKLYKFLYFSYKNDNNLFLKRKKNKIEEFLKMKGEI